MDKMLSYVLIKFRNLWISVPDLVFLHAET